VHAFFLKGIYAGVCVFVCRWCVCVCAHATALEQLSVFDIGYQDISYQYAALTIHTYLHTSSHTCSYL